MTNERKRFPSRVYDHGTEPDARFSLANERTFLAWIRTSLALVAAAIAIEALQVPLWGPIRQIVAVILLALGASAAVQSWWGWVSTERALREGKALRPARVAPWLSIGVVVIVIAVIVGFMA